MPRFKTAPHHRDSIAIYIAFALIEFHRGMDYNALFDPINKKLMKDIMKEFDMTSKYMMKVLHGCAHIRVPLNIISFDDLVTTIQAKLSEVEEFISTLIEEEIDIIFKQQSELCLADFLLPNRGKLSIYSTTIQAIISQI